MCYPNGIVDVTVNGELAPGTADWTITLPLNKGENLIRVKVTDTTGYAITRTIRVIHYDAGCNYNDTDNDGVIDLLDQEDGTPPDSWVDRFGRCEYLRVDDFDYDQTMAFLDGYGWGDQEKEIAWHNVGGKPVSLVKPINAKASEKNVQDVIGSMFTLRTGEIATRLKIVKELGDEMVIGNNHFDVHHGKLVSILEMFASRDEVGADEIDEISKRYLVKENILFVDSLTKMVKPQSQLDLLAIRGVA